MSANNLGSADFQMTDSEERHQGSFGGVHGPATAVERYGDVRIGRPPRRRAGCCSRELKGRHLQTDCHRRVHRRGCLIASGRTLAQGGLASVLLAYTFIGVMLYCTVASAGGNGRGVSRGGVVLCVFDEVLIPSWGFAMG